MIVPPDVPVAGEHAMTTLPPTGTQSGMILHDLSWGLFPGRVTIYLAEKGSIAVDRRDTWDEAAMFLDLGEVRKVSPTGKVPVLVTEEGAAITESRAILEYLEDRFPEPNLIGATPAERARTRELLDVLDQAATHFATWTQHGSPIFIGRVEQIEGAAAQARSAFFEQIFVLDRMAGSGPFLGGDRLTLADCVLAATLRFAEGLYGVRLPDAAERLRVIYRQLSARPSMRPPPFPHALTAAAQGLDRLPGA
jgi:glutathione S-transferase